MIKFITQSPKKALKPFLKQRPLEKERDAFKTNLIALLDQIDVIEKMPKEESEEHLKNLISRFLLKTYYENTNEVNTKDKKDLVIYENKRADSDALVIIEAKRPSNTNEMMTAEKPNKKALHELILYYLNERQTGNFKLKNLVVTNINKWFIIDANYFDKYIYGNPKIIELHKTKGNDKKTTPFFYEEVAKIVETINVEIPCVYFDLSNYKEILRNAKTDDDKELVSLYKVLSPQHLLKIASPNDGNKLDEGFYKELLHIIGLKETKEGTKNIITRKKENKNAASLIELTIEALKTEDTFHHIQDIKVYGENKDEQTFNIALELCITWINRILFLKLLEGQLISYHQGNKDYRFLNSEIIHDYDELFKLFHKVLAVNITERTEAIKTKYRRVPYLNSSLFEISELEDQTIKINSLENDGQLELINTTILKEIKKKKAKLPSLDYLFQFLDAYDFASEGTEDWQKDNKQLINASVLGKVFEKINGYRDGSIFTPAFITMYMCRQSIRMAVVEKFNEALSEKGKKLFDKFDDIKNYTRRHYKTEDLLKANEIINSLHICDPAVGSGHFLVSALNEIITIKAELGILADDNGINLSGYEIETINDELIITDQQGNLFEYKLQNGKPISKEIQRLQKTLFQQKQIIIENCLFGVDINPKSVLICRLRLWIELLKNAYYKEAEYTELETLPNIDINIKCGNSLLSRFALEADLTKALKSIKYDIKSYRGFVNDYKNEKNREVKRGLQKIIDGIKSDFKTEIIKTGKDFQNYYKAKGDVERLTQQFSFFDLTPKEKKKWNEDVKLATEKMKKNEAILDEIRNNIMYKNAFEWRFEFPEVLNNVGDFEGFDLIIGNPPYGVSLKDGLRAAIVNNLSKVPDFEIYYFFINLSKMLLKPNGIKTYIIPNTILFNVFAKSYRENLFQNWQIQEILDCTDFNVFEGSATVRCIITQFINKKSDDLVYYRPTENITSFEELKERKLNTTTKAILLENNKNWALVFKLNADVLNLIGKIKNSSSTIISNFDVSQGYIPYRQSDLIKIYGKDKAKSIVENREWHSSNKINTEYKQEIWGENISKFGYTKPQSYVWYGKHLAGYVDLKYFNQQRILIREITNPTIIACLVSDELVNDPQIISIIPKTMKIDLKILWAIFNSKLATFYHFNSSPKATKGAFPKILVEDIKTFPLPKISSNEELNIIKLVDKIISLKQQGKDSSEQEYKIDKMVYKFYNLNYNEVLLVDPDFTNHFAKDDY